MTPGSCSTGIHILLEELELAFEVYPVNLLAGDQHRPEYRALNPKGTIPTLVRDDGVALTEFQSIAWWLARKYPKAGLLPPDCDGEAKILEAMALTINNIHMQGYARYFTTDQFAMDKADHTAVRNRGLEIVAQGYAILDAMLDGHDYVTDRFSIADAALFYVEFWGDRLKLELPRNVRAHYHRLLIKPSVQRVLAEEGYRL